MIETINNTLLRSPPTDGDVSAKTVGGEHSDSNKGKMEYGIPQQSENVSPSSEGKVLTSVPVSVLSTSKNTRKRNFSNDASERDDGDEAVVVSPQQRQHLEDKPPVIETAPVPVMDWEAAAKKDLPPENPMDWTTVKDPTTSSVQEPMKLTEFESSLKLQPFTNSNADINEQAPKEASLTLSNEFSQKPLQASLSQFQVDKNVFNTSSSTLGGSSVFVTKSGTQQSSKGFVFDGSSTSNFPSVTETVPTFPVNAVDSTDAYQNTSAASSTAYLTNHETPTAYQSTPVVSKVPYQAAPIVSTTSYQTATQGSSTIYQAAQAAPPPVVSDVLQEFLPKPDDLQSNQSYLLKVANKVQTEQQQPVAFNMQTVLSTPSANLVSAPFTGGKIDGENISATSNAQLVPKTEYKREYLNQSQTLAVSQSNVTCTNESNNVSKSNDTNAFTQFATSNLGIAPGQNTVQPMVTSNVQAPVSAFSSGTELPSAYGQNITYKPITNSLPVITLPAPITSTMISSNSVYSTLPTTMAEVQTKMVVESTPAFAGLPQQTGTTSVTVPREVGKSLFESTNSFTHQTGKNSFTNSPVVGDFPSQPSSDAFIQNSQLLGASATNGTIFSTTDAVVQKPFSNVVTVKSSEECSRPLQSNNIYSQPMAVPMAVDSFNGTAAIATVNNASQQLPAVQPMAFETTLPTAPSGKIVLVMEI